MDRAHILDEIQKNATLLSSANFQYIPLHQVASPAVQVLREMMKQIRKVVFPGFFGTEQEANPDTIQYYTGVYLEQIYDMLQEQIYHGLCFESNELSNPKEQASEVAIAFINKIQHIKYLLSTDVKAILDGDPAAKSPSEIIF
ncbi:MAG: serine acetyltransferase, partial [Parabacteroides sp.]|nr:serine acetyltransferase [Parabacteroides sp.]